MKPKTAGFTLIELLVVISIIALLSSVVLGSVNSARNRAVDARLSAEMNSIVKALEIYRTNTGSYPYEGQDSWTDEYCGNTSFADAFQPLVSTSVLSSVPAHPSNTSCSDGYNYYVYWTNSDMYGFSNFTDNDMRCGDRPIRQYMLAIYSDRTLPKGLGYLTFGGQQYLEYHCTGM